jgi:hypothetical protein
VLKHLGTHFIEDVQKKENSNIGIKLGSVLGWQSGGNFYSYFGSKKNVIS